MIYDFSFSPVAFKKWNSLSIMVRDLFRDKLDERCENPRHKPSKVVGKKGHYVIKLRRINYLLVYEVRDDVGLVVVISIHERELKPIKVKK